MLYIWRFLVITNRHLCGLPIMVDKFSGDFLAITDRLFQSFLKPWLTVQLDFYPLVLEVIFNIVPTFGGYIL